MGPTKGKSFDTGNAMGPWIATHDELPDYRTLQVKVRVNGEVRGSNPTSGLIHSFEDIVACISRHETLHPGAPLADAGASKSISGSRMAIWLKSR